MPHYYSSKTETFGNVIVTPKEWYRKIFKFGNYSICPYKVGDEIKFTVKVDRIETSLERTSYFIWEKMGNSEWIRGPQLKVSETEVNIEAGYTGDTKFFICGPTSPDINKEGLGVKLFYEELHSLTHYIFGWVGIIVTAILTGVCGLIVGLTINVISSLLKIGK